MRSLSQSGAGQRGRQTRPPGLLVSYNLLLLALSLLLLPVFAIGCLTRPRWRQSLGDRLGVAWPRPEGSPVLWAHAASVGEIEGIAPLVRRWRAAHPGGEVIVSALTATGCDAARRLLPGTAVRVFPLDFPPIMGRVARRLSPDLFLFSENEIWPNALFALYRRGVPIVQVSGRLSPGAAATLARVPRFARAVTSWVSRFCVQAEEHRRRLLALGVPAERIVVTGSLKADTEPAAVPEFVAALRSLDRPVVVAGSTHPGEEEILLEVFETLSARVPRPFWILAPRHPERFGTVAALLERRGVAVRRRSAIPSDPSFDAAGLRGCDMLLLDTLGELAGCYRAATVAFVGGSLVPVGGHNLLEPARASVPVVTGPHVESVAKLARALCEAGAGAIADSAAELARAIGGFLDRSPGVGAAALAIAEREAGSLPTTWAVIEEVLRSVAGGDGG